RHRHQGAGRYSGQGRRGRQGDGRPAPVDLRPRRHRPARQRLLLTLLAVAERVGEGRGSDRARRDGGNRRRPEFSQGTAPVLRDSRREPDRAGSHCVAEIQEIEGEKEGRLVATRTRRFAAQTAGRFLNAPLSLFLSFSPSLLLSFSPSLFLSLFT